VRGLLRQVEASSASCGRLRIDWPGEIESGLRVAISNDFSRRFVILAIDQ
jgi:hypothetical protein